MTRWAKITTSFEGFHRYPSAPDDVQFLRDLHRHMFHVHVYVEQFHNERDLEYFQVQRWLKSLANGLDWPLTVSESTSCEALAEWIGHAVQQKYTKRRVMVEVLEDGENGALIELGDL